MLKDFVKPSYFGNLIPYLDRAVGMKSVDRLIPLYNVGGMRRGENILWRLNKDSEPLNGNAIMYDTNNGRVLACEPVTHKLMKPWKWWATYPAWFGGHLVRNASTIAVVQDELTAMLGAVAEPSLVWLAAGVGQDITADMLTELNGHDVILFADDMNVEAWHRLKLPSRRMQVSDNFVKYDINSYFINILK